MKLYALATLVGTVWGLLQEEMSQSWSHHHFGSLTQFHPLTNQTAVGLTQTRELVLLDLAFNSLTPQWTHPLSLEGPAPGVVVRQGEIVVHLERTLQVWTPQGFLSREFQLPTEIVGMTETLGDVAVLLTDGSIHLVFSGSLGGRLDLEGPDEKERPSPKLAAHGAQLYVYQALNDQTKVTELSGGQTVHEGTVAVAFADVVSVTGAFLTTTTSLYRITAGTAERLGSGLLAVCGAHYAIGHLSEVRIYGSGKPVLVAIGAPITALNYVVLEKTLVVYTATTVVVIDLANEYETRTIALGAAVEAATVFTLTTEQEGDVHQIQTLVQSAHTLCYYIDSTPIWSVNTALGSVVGHAVVEKKPKPVLSTDEVIQEEASNPLVAYLTRLRKHLALRTEAVAVTDSETFFGVNRKLVLLTQSGALYAYNTEQGELLWHREVAMVDDEVALQVTAYANDVFVLTSKAVLRLTCCGAVVDHQRVKATRMVETTSGLFLDTDEGFIPLDATSAPSFTFKQTAEGLTGYRLAEKTTPTWSLMVNPNEHMVVAVRPPRDVTASIGVVLGDRKVLYKYLRPHVAAVALATDTLLTVKLLDTITGTVLYTAVHQEAIDPKSVALIVGEHWLVYAYYAREPSLEQRLVVVDLFESLTPNQRHSSGVSSALNFTEADVPETLSQAYILDARVSSLAQTITKNGITTRNVLVGLQNGQILAVPKYILSARRVAGRPLMDVERQEFMNFPYDAAVPTNDWSVLSHELGLAPLGAVLSYPTELESTAIVCSYGQSYVFCGRTTPSGRFDVLAKNFERSKLVFTIAVLVVAVIFTRPIVQRKVLKDFWCEAD